MTQPIKKFSAGGINVAIWENDASDGRKFNSVSLSRNYKDKNDQWQSTNSMKINDIPKAIVALNQAYEYLVMKNKEEQSEALLKTDLA